MTKDEPEYKNLSNILRVHFEEDGFLSIMPFDTLRWLLQPPIFTKNMADVPEWVQQRIAILMMLKPREFVEGVGRRVDETTFWVYLEENNDTRSKSETKGT